MAFNLPSDITTPQVFEAVQFELERLRDWLSDSAVKRKVGAKPLHEPSCSPETKQLLGSWLGDKAPSANQLTALIEELRKLKPVTVHIVLAALPGDDLKQRLVGWFRTNCLPDVLVGFSADRTIGGGIIVRTPNRIFDYSFRERLAQGRAKIPELVRNVR